MQRDHERRIARRRASQPANATAADPVAGSSTLRSLVPDPRHASRKMTEVEDGLRECPQLKILRVEGSIYFGAVHHIDSHFDTLRQVSAEQKHLLLMAKSINFVDIAGAELLATEARRRRAIGGRLYFYSLRRPVEDVLKRSGFMQEIGTGNVFRGKQEAISGVFAQLDRSICERCTARKSAVAQFVGSRYACKSGRHASSSRANSVLEVGRHLVGQRSEASKQLRSRRSPSTTRAVAMAPYPRTSPGRAAVSLARNATV